MTYIYIEITSCDFHDAFYKFDRQNDFTYAARQKLYDYLIDSGEPIELDVIGLCCEWCEYENKEELEEYYEQPLEDIKEEHMVIKTNIDSYLVSE